MKSCPHTTNLQQTTLKTNKQKYGKSLKVKEYLLNQIESIVAKGESAHMERLLNKFIYFPHAQTFSGASAANVCLKHCYSWRIGLLQSFPIFSDN